MRVQGAGRDDRDGPIAAARVQNARRDNPIYPSVGSGASHLAAWPRRVVGEQTKPAEYIQHRTYRQRRQSEL